MIDYADLVARLRTIAPSLPNDKGYSTTVPQAVLRAADHIEALVKERDRSLVHVVASDKALEAAEAEVAKLKEALTKIASFQSEMPGWYVKVAQSALEGK